MSSIYSYSVVARDFNIMVFHGQHLFLPRGGARDFNSMVFHGQHSFLLRGGARDFNSMVFHGPIFIPYSALARATSISWPGLPEVLSAM